MKKRLNKYKYNLFKLLLTILLFPYIFIKSKKDFKLYKDFCYTYPRKGIYNGRYKEKMKQDIIVDSFDYHLWDLKHMNLKHNTFNKDQIIEFDILCEKGNISCIKILNNNSKKWVIGLHGWTENKFLALRFLKHFYDEGYNILTFDAFAHGKSYGQFTDIGLSSIYMIDKIIEYLKNNYLINSIGLIGVSMGSSTSILYSQIGSYKENISWVVADCGFSNLKYQYRFYIENNFFKKPWWLNGFLYTKKFSKITKTSQGKYNLLKNMKSISIVPIFFIHGTGDTFIPYEMSVLMYDKKIKYEKILISQIWLPKNSEHIYVISDYYEEFKQKTISFVKKIK